MPRARRLPGLLVQQPPPDGLLGYTHPNEDEANDDRKLASQGAIPVWLKPTSHGTPWPVNVLSDYSFFTHE